MIGERGKDGKWTYKMVDGTPDDDQKKELKQKQGPENDDDLYPAEKVPSATSGRSMRPR